MTERTIKLPSKSDGSTRRSAGTPSRVSSSRAWLTRSAGGRNDLRPPCHAGDRPASRTLVAVAGGGTFWLSPRLVAGQSFKWPVGRGVMQRSEPFTASLTEEGRYRLLVEAVTDYAIYMLDASGIVTSWNPGAQRFKGYTPAEIIGQHFSRFYSEEDRNAGLPARALATAAREGTFESEGWRIRKDGTRFWAYVVIDPIRDPSGGIVGFAKVTRDLTERKKAEQVLKQSEEQFRLLVQ